MTNLLTLLAECECWLGVEPTDEAQVAEVTELRERVRKAVDVPMLTSEKEPLPKAAASFLDSVAAKRGLDGLE